MPKSSWRSSWWSRPDACCTMGRCVISVSHIHRTVVNLSHTVRGLCGHTCVRLCVYSSWWLMQGKSRWVKTTSVRCSVWEVIIYSLCTKLPSNLTLFLVSLQRKIHFHWQYSKKQKQKQNKENIKPCRIFFLSNYCYKKKISRKI